jgi:hypothetical protein
MIFTKEIVTVTLMGELGECERVLISKLPKLVTKAKPVDFKVIPLRRGIGKGKRKISFLKRQRNGGTRVCLS